MKALVTGGGGFLGGAIVRRLVERGDEVRSLSRGKHPILGELGVEAHRGDVSDPKVVLRAVRGVDAVFHVAAKPGIWGRYADYYRTNTEGTLNIIEACRVHGVSRLVYTSTPSVVHAGGDIAGADESLPYPEHFEAAYPETKALAEKAVLAANDAVLATVALRPHLIWGPGDNHLVPGIIDRAKAGRLRFVGRPLPLVDSTFVEDAATAHLLAADRLAPDAPCAGRAYFISQGEPWAIDRLINGILGAAGMEPVTRYISPRLAWFVGGVLELAYRVLGIDQEPVMTRFLARQLSTAHWYDIGAARRDLGYEPACTIDEGLEMLRASLAEDSAVRRSQS